MKRVNEGASGASLRSAPSAPGFCREAVRGNGRQPPWSRKLGKKDKQEAKATGGNGRQRERSRRLGDREQQEAKATESNRR